MLRQLDEQIRQETKNNESTTMAIIHHAQGVTKL